MPTVERVLGLLQAELAEAMAITGVRRIEEIDRLVPDQYPTTMFDPVG